MRRSSSAAWLLARAYTYKYHAQGDDRGDGLGETEFSSDLIVWNGFITAEAQNVEAGYAQIESSKKKVYDYLLSKGIAAEAVVFQFVNVTKQYEPVYSANGSWAGQRFTGYRLSQGFTVESKSVDAVENVSREISSLIAQGVSIEAMQPDYYYTKLDDVKLSLIEKASADARVRAEKIAVNAGAKLGGVASARRACSRSRVPIPTRSSRPEDRSTPRAGRKRPVSPCGSNTALSKRYGKSCKNRPGLTSRWTERIFFVLLLAAVALRNDAVWRVVSGAFVVWVMCALWAVAPTLRKPARGGRRRRMRPVARRPNPNMTIKRKSTKSNEIWKDLSGCASHPALRGLCISAAYVRRFITTCSRVGTAVR